MLNLLLLPSLPASTRANYRRPACSGAMLTAPICSLLPDPGRGSPQLPHVDAEHFQTEPRVSV